MKQFYLDIGNTRYKLASYGDGMWSIIAEGIIDELGVLTSTLMDTQKGDLVVISSVRRDILAKLEKLFSDQKVQIIGPGDIPVNKLDYHTPQSLGMDRYLVALAAYHESQKSVMVLDAGSAITMDYMDDNGIFKGGVIIPGIRIQNRSVSFHLPELPDTDVAIPANWPGKSSKECLEWGLYGSIQLILNGFIKKYMESGTDPDIYLTGGDSKQIQPFIESGVTIRHRQFLLFDGMKLFTET